MSGWLDSLNFGLEQISLSGKWLRVVNVMCLVGIVTSLLSLVGHWRGHRRMRGGMEPGSNLFAKVTIHLLFVAIVVGLIQVWLRYIEVNHFPSQTMSEVIVVFSLALLFSMWVLHYVLRLRQFGPGWATLNDTLGLITFAGALFWGTSWPRRSSRRRSAAGLTTYSSTSTRTPTGSRPTSCWH